MAAAFVVELERRMAAVTGDSRETASLVAIQRGIAIYRGGRGGGGARGAI